eukprot:scaffold39999_cov63-Phaeocystis_antarctica.AAC.3
MLWAQTLKERDVALGGVAARLPGVVARPGGGCMAAGHALVIWVALGGCPRIRPKSHGSCNDPAITLQTCPPSRRWELTNHPDPE